MKIENPKNEIYLHRDGVAVRVDRYSNDDDTGCGDRQISRNVRRRSTDGVR